jgi:hypothetical protein
MDSNSVTTLVERASFIFAGTVTRVGASSLRALPASSDLAVVRLDREFLVNPVLGDVVGRPVTLQLRPKLEESAPLKPGDRQIFFTTAWVHGEEIAVTELDRLADSGANEQEVARVVDSLPELHLSERIRSAVLIMRGKVVRIERATDAPRTGSEHDPFWMRAFIEVTDILKGSPSEEKGKPRMVELLFPGSSDIAFRNVPRPAVDQEAVFLLHHGASSSVPQGALIAPDPADIQPAGRGRAIRRLISNP